MASHIVCGTAVSTQTEWVVVPGRSVGPLCLGMPVSRALALLKKKYPACIVDVFYGEADPLAVDILVRVRQLGIILRFEPKSQRLRLIDVNDTSKVCLLYGGSPFSGKKTVSSFIRVYDLFGPTFPGEMCEEKGAYFLHYRGLSFAFPIPKQYHHLYTSSNEMPLELPDATTPVASRVFVFAGSDLCNPEIPPSARFDPAHCIVTLEPGGGCSMAFSRGSSMASFSLGSPAQAVLSALGPPSKAFCKPPSKMHIHSLRASAGSGSSAADHSGTISRRHSEPAAVAGAGSGAGPFDACPDYFLNYFDLGVDVLLDGESHCVRKLVFRTNCPGHPEFNNYMKCRFTLRVPVKPSKPPLEPAAPSAPPASSGGKKGRRRKSGPRAAATAPPPEAAAGTVADVAPMTSVDITDAMTWSDVEARLGEAGRPMVHTHGVASNPFGPTFFYAYSGLVFEVMKGGHVTSVTVFSTTR